MRTTLDIDPTALEAARQLASHRAQTLGQVVSELILDGLKAQPTLSKKSGFPLFPRALKPVTLEDVKQAEDEE